MSYVITRQELDENKENVLTEEIGKAVPTADVPSYDWYILADDKGELVFFADFGRGGVSYFGLTLALVQSASDFPSNDTQAVQAEFIKTALKNYDAKLIIDRSISQAVLDDVKKSYNQLVGSRAVTVLTKLFDPYPVGKNDRNLETIIEMDGKEIYAKSTISEFCVSKNEVGLDKIKAIQIPGEVTSTCKHVFGQGFLFENFTTKSSLLYNLLLNTTRKGSPEIVIAAAKKEEEKKEKKIRDCFTQLKAYTNNLPDSNNDKKHIEEFCQVGEFYLEKILAATPEKVRELKTNLKQAYEDVQLVFERHPRIKDIILNVVLSLITLGIVNLITKAAIGKFMPINSVAKQAEYITTTLTP